MCVLCRYSRADKPDDGVRSARLCRVLLEKRHVEQQQLSELAMMSIKETRERLYQMYRDSVVTFQEVPKRADHYPNATIYLWTLNMKQVSTPTHTSLDRPSDPWMQCSTSGRWRGLSVFSP